MRVRATFGDRGSCVLRESGDDPRKGRVRGWFRGARFSIHLSIYTLARAAGPSSRYVAARGEGGEGGEGSAGGEGGEGDEGSAGGEGSEGGKTLPKKSPASALTIVELGEPSLEGGPA